jgi:hypothetical protein
MSNSLSPRELTVEAEPSPDDIRYLEDSIYAFNVRATGIADGELFGIFLRDDARVVVGGAFGWTWARSCKVRILFVPIHLRNQGHGTNTGRASNPLDHDKRFQITHPPFLDLSWRYRNELPPL